MRESTLEADFACLKYSHLKEMLMCCSLEGCLFLLIANCVEQIDREVVGPHVPQLLDALLVCFKDESWPVRDGMLLNLTRIL